MSGQKKIVDAEADSKGNISKVRFRGNRTFTPIDTAIRMAERGKIENAHVVKPKKGDPYLRSNPDRRKGNNLDEMAGDNR
ncbi:DUF3892 domain-containing protein [bacterium]|nr:DUF3892 domain-containing protein [bacterium]